MISAPDGYDTGDSAAAVVTHVRRLIDHGALGPGARLPPERDLAQQIGVSRPTVRAGLRTLAALGVVRSRRGSGTYIPDGPPTLGADALSFLAALHKFTQDDVYEARRILEVGAAGLAAERAPAPPRGGGGGLGASLLPAPGGGRVFPVPPTPIPPPRRRRGAHFFF